MESLVQFYFKKGIAPTTQATYKTGQERYLKFCLERGFNPIPLNEQGVSFYVSYLASQGLKHSSIKVYLSAIRYMQIASGMSDPFANVSWPRLDYVMKGIKKSQAEKGVKTRPRLPITPLILRKLKEIWDSSADKWDTKMIWAACCLCFLGVIWCGEMTVPGDNEFDESVHLSVADISVDHPEAITVVQVFIKASKMDPFRRGVKLFLEKTGSDLCPVAALVDYLCVRGSGTGPIVCI